MPGRMQRHLDVADPEHLAIRQCLLCPPGLVAEPMVHDRQRLGGRQDRTMAGAGVIGMAVGDDGPIDGAKRVDIEGTGGDVEALRPYLGPGLGVWGRHEATSWAAEIGRASCRERVCQYV